MGLAQTAISQNDLLRTFADHSFDIGFVNAERFSAGELQLGAPVFGQPLPTGTFKWSPFESDPRDLDY